MKVITIFILMCLFSTVSFAESLPDDSIYHIESTWVDQNKASVQIEELRGQVQVIAFVYTYCEHSCPIIMSRLKAIAKNIPENARNSVHFSLFSLDPERDTPEQLKLFAKKHRIDEKHWSFYNGDPDNVLELAALVGVKYKPMNNGNDDIAHSNMITVLDKQGRIVHQVKGFEKQLKTVVNVISSKAN